MSKKLEDRGLIRAAGVLADPINESGHKPVMLDTLTRLRLAIKSYAIVKRNRCRHNTREIKTMG